MTSADNEELEALDAAFEQWWDSSNRELCFPECKGVARATAHAMTTALRARVAELEHNIEAYRGALGYPVRGDHDGRLSNGETPICGLCDAKTIQLQQVKADAERYRWLRGPDSHTEYHAAWTLGWRITDGNNPYHGKRCDTGIDAARRNDGTA